MAVLRIFRGSFLGVPLFAAAPIHSLNDYYIMFLCGYLVSDGEEVFEIFISSERRMSQKSMPCVQGVLEGELLCMKKQKL